METHLKVGFFTSMLAIHGQQFQVQFENHLSHLSNVAILATLAILAILAILANLASLASF